MGLLLSLFVLAALVSLYQAQIVDGKVREITEVAEPTSDAAYEMELTVIGTGTGVLNYLQTRDDVHRQRVVKDEADFERYKLKYDLLAETPRGKELGERVSLLYQEYKALGETLMNQADRREVLFTTLGENLEELDKILDEKIQDNIDLQAPDGAEKLQEAKGMEANIAEVGTWLGSYLQTPKEEYKQYLYKNADDFWEEFNRFENLRLTAKEQAWAAELEDLFSKTQALSAEMIALEADLRRNLAEFVDLGTKLDAVLDDEILVMTHQDLAEATQVAHDMEARTKAMVLVLLLGGLACGTITAVAITRGITGPVGKLVSASRAIARGDLSQRVDVQTKDEFGILGESFNEMIAQRHRAYEELENRVQERTAELSQVNEVMNLADEVARIVTSTLNIDEVYEKFALEVKKLVDFDRVVINMIDRESGTAILKYRFGSERPGRPLHSTMPLAGSQNLEVLTTERSLVRNDFAKDLRFTADKEAATMGLRSSIMIPLWSKSQVIGTLGLRSKQVGAFGPRQQTILERLASQIAPALENSQLYLRLQANMEEMNLVDEVARIVTSTLNIDEVYEKFALEVKKLVDFDRMNINLIDHDAGIFAVKYQAGLFNSGLPVGDMNHPMEGQVRYIVATGRTLVRPDLAQDIRFPLDQGHVEAGLRSSIAVPLVSKNRVAGVLALRSSQMDAYGSREQAILERLAHQIAPAVENARLHEERVLAEERLSHAQKMESVGRLAGGVAHDFNNLLTAIMGYSQLSLREAPPESPISNHLREIQQATERAADLTNQLLAFSRHQVIEPKVIDLNDLVFNLDKMLRRLIGEDIELVTLPTANLEPVKADLGQIEQVLVNLAVNARDSMPKGGKLTIETANVILDTEYLLHNSAASPGRHVMLVVSDTGMGISKEVQDHIFEPFFTTKDVGKGTGLGLATCYGTVQQSGGHIEVCSEPGRGTSFKVYLPVTEETSEAQPQKVDSSISPRGKETVLLAEDEPMVRSMAAMVLRDRGYEVLEAANGEEALRVVQNHGGEGIELLLTDVVMPQMGGPELAEKLHAVHPEIKILFTSGYTGDYLSQLNTLTTGTEFLAKPYTPEALAVMVREVLDQRAV